MTQHDCPTLFSQNDDFTNNYAKNVVVLCMCIANCQLGLNNRTTPLILVDNILFKIKQ